ncbi:MAG: EamA family transporter [Hyphomicrobiales bacterium]|jgi:O-acetylserine/cysteine efflux transporter|nr:EamA family transporter [Hyphomicrobiales bacterium]MCC7482787.1 EamA family transporter [Hyphomicrobiales bacterium]
MNSKTLLLALVAPICWGTGLAIAKPAVTHFPPMFMMLMVYFAIAVITLITVHDRIKTPWRSLLLISAFSVTIQGAFVFWGLRGVEATTANLVLQTQVPMAVFLGWLIAGEELNLRKIMGTAIALAGVGIVIGLPEQRPALLPVTLVILGGFFWAFGQTLARKLSQDSGIVLLKANALMGVPQLILATAIFETGQWHSITSAGTTEWATLAFVGFVGFYLAYIAWFSLLRRCRMDDAAPFVLLMTPIGLLTAVIVLGERMSGAQLLGAVVLLLGLAIVNGFLMPKQKLA